MKARASARSSCAISSSILAQIGTAESRRRVRNVLHAGELDSRLCAFGEIRFVEVQHHEQRLRRQELKAAQPLRVLGSELAARAAAGRFERLAAALQDLLLLPQLGVLVFLMSRSSRSSRRSTTPRSARMTSSSIARDVARGIDRSCRVRHRGIAEHADDVQQRVGVAERRDVEQRLRAGLRRRRAGDIGELHGRRHLLARVEQRRQLDRGARREPGPRPRSRPTCRRAAASLMLVSSWKRDVLPEEGKPIRPARNIRKLESIAPAAGAGRTLVTGMPPSRRKISTSVHGPESTMQISMLISSVSPFGESKA